ncbi:FecR domain-containing protein [Prevotella sp.]|uniref:FecR family protein n=1 Tax=Prevotella sp. TaxID=59823 RepID=UPI003F8124FB
MTDNDMQRLWTEASDIANKLSDMRSIDTETAYKNVRHKARSNRLRRAAATMFSRAAAVLVLPLIMSTATLYYMYTHERSLPAHVAMIEVTASTGTTARVMLPDSSEVWLNSDSRLTYPQTFDSRERTVNLKGEAFFSVSSDRQHPFNVCLDGGLRVMAHGTRFNVCSYDDSDNVEMTLERGAIDVMRDGNTLERLKPNEQVVYDRRNHSWTLNRVDVEEYGSWKSGRLVFRNMPLDKVFEQIGRRYNAYIVVHDADLKRCNIRATFGNESMEQILADIRLVAPIRWTATTTPGGRNRIDIYSSKAKN